MNALVKKEIRLLTPGFAGCMVLALTVGLAPGFLGSIRILSLFCLALLTMAIGTFGREFSTGNFPMLMALPVSRERIWRTKIVPLTAFVLLACCTWGICWMLYAPSIELLVYGRSMGVFVALSALAMYSGGLWSALLFRQTAAAFWFSLLTPAALFVILGKVTQNQPRVLARQEIIVAFSLYGVTGYIFARWLFLRAQDVQWTGGDIRMPELGLTWFKAGACERREWRPRMALLLKECQLHQSQFMIASLMLLFHLVGLAMRKYDNVPKYSALEAVFESFFLVWLAMPLLVGCAAAAEERKLGTLEGQLCLPVKRRTQFLMKYSAVIVFSVLLGTVIPLLLEGGRILPQYYNHQDLWIRLSRLCGKWGQPEPDFVRSVLNSLPLLTLIGISVGIGSVAFYFSTLVRNTLQALAPSIVGFVLLLFLISVADWPERFVHLALWRGSLIYFIAWPVMVAVVVWLAWRNYQCVVPGWNLWRKNLFIFALGMALVAGVTSAVYYRAWEWLTPMERSHGAAVLAPGGARLWANHGDITVYLPDGRVWFCRSFLFTQSNKNELHISGKFLDGKWTDIVVSENEIAGIRRDGSLWVSEKPDDLAEGKMAVPEFTKLVRVGNANDWKSVHTYQDNGPGYPDSSFYLLKNGGTLWKLEFACGKDSVPEQVGTDSDWTDMRSEFGGLVFRRVDGTMWAFRESWRGVISEKVQWNPKQPFVSVYKSQDQLPDFLENKVRNEHMLPFEFYAELDEISGKIQNDVQSHWRKAIFDEGQNEVFSLKGNGTLWRWRTKRLPGASRYEVRSSRFGTNSDWVDISEEPGGFVSLAGDGGLWLWQFETANYNPTTYFKSSLLAPSRKPRYLGNIFGNVPRH